MEQQSLTLLTGRQVGAMLGLSRTSLFRRSREGSFPAAIELGHGQIRWREEDIRDWLSKLPSRQYPVQGNRRKRGAVRSHNGGGNA
jgi:prophage regulatory protein